MGQSLPVNGEDSLCNNYEVCSAEDRRAMLSDVARLSELENYGICGEGRIHSADLLCTTARIAFAARFCAMTVVDHVECHILGLSGSLFRTKECLSEPTIATLCSASKGDFLLIDEIHEPAGIDQPAADAKSVRIVGIPVSSQNDICLGALILGLDPGRDFQARDHTLALSFIANFLHTLETQRTQLKLEQRIRISRRQSEILKQQKQALTRNDRLFSKVSKVARIGGWELDCITGAMEWSGEIRALFGLPPGTAVEYRQIFRCLGRDNLATLRTLLRDCREKGLPFEKDFKISTITGEERWFCIAGEAERSDTEIIKVFGTIQDVSNQKRREDRIHHVATHDELTGLPNRMFFNAELSRLLTQCRRSNETMALILIDADHFKSVNDVHGHDAGDVVLQAFAEHLKFCFRDDDLIARLGGDEFAAIVPGVCDGDTLDKICDRLQARLAAGIAHNSGTSLVSASAGYAVFPEHGDEAQDLLRKADMALYHSKENGRARHTRYDSSMCKNQNQRQQVLESIALAIQAGDIIPHFQPVVDGFTGSVASLEALIRWQTGDGQALPPAAFSEAFDDPATLAKIGDTMIERAIAQILIWKREGMSTGPIAINLSGAELQQRLFCERLLSRLRNAGLDPSCLSIEVTEGVFLSRGNTVVRNNLEALWKAGIRIALDDFGTGFASLTHLKDFPVDLVKIDRSFVAQIVEDSESLGIVKSIISLGRNLDMRVVAEGVETEQQAQLLRHLGCDYLQGYHFSKPVPAAAVPQLLNRLETCLLEPVRAVRNLPCGDPGLQAPAAL